MRVHYLYRDHPLRRKVFNEGNRGDRNLIYGLDYLENVGFSCSYSLFQTAPSNDFSCGIWREVFKRRGILSEADVVVVTNDEYLSPILILREILFLRFRICYISMGLCEKKDLLERNSLRWILSLFRKNDRFICFGWDEHLFWRKWYRRSGDKFVRFIPFGVDFEGLSQFSEIEKDDGTFVVFSMGGDKNRDYDTLIKVAEKLPDINFQIIANKQHESTLRYAPKWVDVQYDVPFEDAIKKLNRCSMVLLCCKENRYSGATTVLLQSMAMGKACLATKTGAIVDGYGLKDKINCLLTRPVDVEGIVDQILFLKKNTMVRLKLGQAAREFVREQHTWDRFCNNLQNCLEEMNN